MSANNELDLHGMLRLPQPVATPPSSADAATMAADAYAAADTCQSFNASSSMAPDSNAGATSDASTSGTDAKSPEKRRRTAASKTKDASQTSPFMFNGAYPLNSLQ